MNWIDKALSIIGDFGVPIFLLMCMLALIFVGVTHWLIPYLIDVKARRRKEWGLEEDPQKKSDRVDLIGQTRRSKLIRDWLFRLVHQVPHAIRASVFEYHDGVKSAGGLHFCFATCTFEQINEVDSEIHRSGGIQASFLYTINTAVVEKKFLAFEQISQLREKGDEGLFRVLRSRRVVSCFFHGLYDISGRAIGFIAVETGLEAHRTEELNKLLTAAARRIEPCLCNYTSEEDFYYHRVNDGEN